MIFYPYHVNFIEYRKTKCQKEIAKGEKKDLSENKSSSS